MADKKTSLVIVESPAKARTIGKYLGDGYRVAASMGHLRDLPKSTMGVDIKNGFIPDYRPVKGREETIDRLKKEAGISDKIFLATDPDREGEAISWHLKELLGLSDEEAFRVTFNEITKKVVSESIKNPRSIDTDLVNAQQARRILDRIVGYELSPLLWRKIRKGLSAGRVQSVAVRLVSDREAEIKSFVPEEYWLIRALLFERENGGKFTAVFYGVNGKKTEVTSEAEANKITAAVTDAPFTVKTVKRAEKQRSPSPPFTTSTLQQDASRKLGMTPKRTMSIAQQLYEGVEISGEGSIGLITYMRTDSLRISDEAASDAGKFITDHFGRESYHGSPRRFKTKGAAQDAHEAIRPSNVFFTPESVKNDLSGEQYKLYRLIWNRFIASQMANAVYDTVQADVESATYTFRANHSVLKFAGYTSVYDDGEDKQAEDSPIPDLHEGEEVGLEKIDSEQKFTQPPLRYTEATLIKAMEEKGVGRPSTYAPTISTIMSREYVVKEGKYLRTTPLGEVVTTLMKERFPDIVDVKFTARMEENLDDVEEGKKEWKSVLSEFYEGFEVKMKEAEEAMNGSRIKVPDEESDELCDKCGRRMVIKSGRFGRFLACPGYPECTNTKPLVIEMPGKCPRCGGRILKRTSKKGYTYYACENLKTCGFMTWDVPVKENCPVCGQTMFKLSGKGQKKPFCINEACANFLPEDKRGYRKRTSASPEEQKDDIQKDEKNEVEKTPAGKKAVKKPAEKKTSEKKTAGKKTAGKKPAAKKPAAKTE